MSTIDGLEGRTRLELPSYVELVFALVIIWGFGDSLSTVLASEFSGPEFVEINPLLRAMLAFDPLVVIVVKGAVVLYVGLTLLACREVVKTVPGWQIWFLGVIGVGTVIVLQNLAVVAVAL